MNPDIRVLAQSSVRLFGNITVREVYCHTQRQGTDTTRRGTNTTPMCPVRALPCRIRALSLHVCALSLRVCAPPLCVFALRWCPICALRSYSEVFYNKYDVFFSLEDPINSFLALLNLTKVPA